MKKFSRFAISLAALLLFSGTAVVLPVSARADDSMNSTDSSQQSTDSGAMTLTAQFRQEAKDKLKAERQALRQEQTQEHRQMACEARKANLTRRMANAVSFANRHKAVFDKIYTRVQDFYTTKQLNVTNYDSLKTAVDSAQSDAQTQIDALTALQVNVDCTSQTVADSVATFQQSIKSTRDSLKAYRAALVDLIKALKGASTGTGSADNTDNSTNQ